uniref:Uncharacterized protein n=1 Tax=Lactuca sativa TaxID=4236 RepID=A0A9R1VJ47_LACSA|nr:hypothetical protein LSAT_V11C500252290 [Lactuca sativa]
MPPLGPWKGVAPLSRFFNNKDEFVQNYKNLSSFNEIELANLHVGIIHAVKIQRFSFLYNWSLSAFLELKKFIIVLIDQFITCFPFEHCGELKKCCNHPFLFESADHGYAGDSATADTVSIFDSDCNPQNDLQILERAEKVEQKGAEDEAEHELLSAFKAIISQL